MQGGLDDEHKRCTAKRQDRESRYEKSEIKQRLTNDSLGRIDAMNEASPWRLEMDW